MEKMIEDIKNNKLELGKTQKRNDWTKGKFEKKGDRTYERIRSKRKMI